MALALLGCKSNLESKSTGTDYAGNISNVDLQGIIDSQEARKRIKVLYNEKLISYDAFEKLDIKPKEMIAVKDAKEILKYEVADCDLLIIVKD